MLTPADLDTQVIRVNGCLAMTEQETVPDELIDTLYEPDIEVWLVTPEGRHKLGVVMSGKIGDVIYRKGDPEFRYVEVADFNEIEIVPQFEIESRFSSRNCSSPGNPLSWLPRRRRCSWACLAPLPNLPFAACSASILSARSATC